MKDKIVQAVIDKFYKRAETGLKKYGTTMERDDIDLFGWLNHLQDELMDACIYVQKLKDENNKQHN